MSGIVTKEIDIRGIEIFTYEFVEEEGSSEAAASDSEEEIEEQEGGNI